MENQRHPEMLEREKFKLDVRELQKNADNRVPIVVCIESSYGMRPYLNGVLDELENFCRTIAEDPIACNCVEVSIISYGGDQAEIVSEFTLAKNLQIPRLKGKGGTPLVDAVEAAMAVMEARRENYSYNGIGSQAPLILFIGGGGMTMPLGKAAKKLHREITENGIEVKCVGVGNPDMIRCSSLQELAPDQKVLYIHELKIKKFFDFLSRAVLFSSSSIDAEQAGYKELDSWDDTVF